jgi:uncharacterized protein with GYD domain
MVVDMPNYLIQVAYNPEGMTALIRSPQNRIEAVRPAIERLGGKVHGGWFSFGEYDVVIVASFPDNVSAAAASMAFSAEGAVKTVKTTPLISAEEAVEAMKKASQSGYKPLKAALEGRG